MRGPAVLSDVGVDGVPPSTYELISAARSGSSQPITLIIIGDQPVNASELALNGVDRVVHIPLSATLQDPENLRRALTHALRSVGSDTLFASFSWNNVSFAPLVAVDMGWALASDIIGVTEGEVGQLVLTRAAHAGKLLVDIDVDGDSGVLVLLRTGSGGIPDAGPTPPIEVLEPPAPSNRVTRIQVIESEDAGVDLTSASIIFAIGRGVSQENISRFQTLTERIGVALGASRPVVDQGLLPHNHQIGQSGVEVQPDLYVAFGISGALQHMVGVRGAKKIVAVNTDRNAPIFASADYGSTDDAISIIDAIGELWSD